MLAMTGRRRVLNLLLLGAVALALAGACSAEQAPRRGELIVAFQTDMSVPKDIKVLVVSIYVGGTRIFFKDYGLQPDGLFHLPATLAIVAGDTPAQPVNVRVVGIDGADKARVLRQAISPIPVERIALLHMPLQWLCKDKKITQSIDIDQFPTYDDECTSKNQTCISGVCRPADFVLADLPTYTPEQVFGGVSGPGLAGGECLDVLACFAGGTEVAPDAQCSLPLPSAGEDSLNVGLVLPAGSDGICSGGACIIPLDHDDLLGWRVEAGRVVLPEAVCDRLGQDIQAVAITSTCPTKTTSVPTCGPWSNVGGESVTDAAPPTKLDAAGDASENVCVGQTDGKYCEWDIGAGGDRVIDCVGGALQSVTDCAPGQCVPGPSGQGQAFCSSGDGGSDGGGTCSGKADGDYCSFPINGSLRDRYTCTNGAVSVPTPCADLCFQGACIAQTLGKTCQAPADCGPLTCLATAAAASQLPNGSAAAGGVCTFPCSTSGTECAQFPNGATCHDFGGGQLRCLERCTPSTTGATKCQGRGDMICSLVLDASTSQPFDTCIPGCTKDADCGAGYQCSFSTRLCEPSPLAATVFGADCSISTCAESQCGTFFDTGGGPTLGCTAPCHLAQLGACGPTFTAPTKSAACVWPKDPLKPEAGNEGLCMELCTCGSSCSHPGWSCYDFGPFVDSGVVTLLNAQGWDGYCGPDAYPDGSAANTCPG
ncbi:MAG: hypothetical protein R3B13_02420 [Polyangiaceae bacterium]